VNAYSDETRVELLRIIDNLKIENAHLRAQNAMLEAKAEEYWGLVECVSIGEKLPCVTCNKYKPCLCDK
jgi:hypothetical protein